MKKLIITIAAAAVLLPACTDSPKGKIDVTTTDAADTTDGDAPAETDVMNQSAQDAIDRTAEAIARNVNALGSLDNRDVTLDDVANVLAELPVDESLTTMLDQAAGRLEISYVKNPDVKSCVVIEGGRASQQAC